MSQYALIPNINIQLVEHYQVVIYYSDYIELESNQFTESQLLEIENNSGLIFNNASDYLDYKKQNYTLE